MSLRVRLDMIAYISEFIMPAWFIIEIGILLMKVIIKGATPHILMSSVIMGGYHWTWIYGSMQI